MDCGYFFTRQIEISLFNQIAEIDLPEIAQKNKGEEKEQTDQECDKGHRNMGRIIALDLLHIIFQTLLSIMRHLQDFFYHNTFSCFLLS